jgi:hypothetical protein
MSRRIEVELTSDRGDGTLTWRAAGAKEPKGILPASLLPSGVTVGDKVKVDADYDMEGVTIVAVLPPTSKKADDNVIEFIGAPPPPPRDYSKEPERRDRKPRRDGRGPGGPGGRGGPGGPGRGGPGGRDGGRERRPQGDRPERPRFDRPEKPKLPPKPKAPRLRAGRTHRQALLAELPEEQRPVAEQVLKGGIPAVRAAIDEQNAAAKEAGNPAVKADALLALAESLVPKARVAEWRDRAEAAIEQIDTVDLRDLRSVVTKAESAAKDEASRELAEKLRTGLAERLEKEQAAWLAEIAELLADDRVVRALNVSSRPPKAGTPLPVDLADRLAAAASAALTDQIGAKRWSTVLEALALSPVHNKVEPASVPASPNEELIAAVTKVSMQVPQIAAKFGIEPKAPPRERGRRSRPRGGPTGGGAPAPSGEKKAPRIPPPPPLEKTPVAPAAKSDAPAVEEVTGVPVDQVPDAAEPTEVLTADAVEATVAPPEGAAMPEVTGVPADAEPMPDGAEVPDADAPAAEAPAAADTPTEDEPVEAEVTEAAAVDDAPTETAESPAEEASTEVAPADETPAVDETPVEDAPAETTADDAEPAVEDEVAEVAAEAAADAAVPTPVVAEEAETAAETPEPPAS